MKQKVFSFSCIPLLAPFAHSNNILYNIPFSCYFNALHIDQQRSTQKLAVLQVHLACCQQLDGQLLNDNNVYPLPSPPPPPPPSSSSSFLFCPLFLVLSLILFTRRSCDQAALAVAANTSITLKKDDPIDAMNRLRCAEPCV